MIELLRKYLRLMRTHDFSYHYSDDFEFWQRENRIRIDIIRLKIILLLVPRGQRLVARAEKRYGHV